MSIRTYIFTLLTGLVLIIAVILSYQSGRLFINAFDMVIEKSMREIGHQYPEAGKVEQTILSFHATTDWSKVPQPVRDKFPLIPAQKDVLHSKFVDWIYIAPPEKSYSLMVIERDEQQVFVSRYNENVRETVEQEHRKWGFFIDPMVIVVLLGLSGLGLFIITLLTIFKKIAVPVESLQQWAKNLKIADLDAARPDFRFKELNGLASLIHDNLVAVAESVKREQTFLSYASHELRTPIAVLRSNSALLEKVNPTPSDKERVIRERIQRASLTMKSMTETLLWLSREGETQMAMESANLGELVDNIQSQLSYLLAGKSVEVNIDVDDSQVILAVTPCVIVLNNLIRNAFQHTQQGRVDIVQKLSEVIVTNVESDSADASNTNNELGFGLGMQLVEKLTAQFGWRYHNNKIDNGYQVSVSFVVDWQDN